jgi:hypothetical protein
MKITTSPIVENGTRKITTPFSLVRFVIAMTGTAAALIAAVKAATISITKTHQSYGTGTVMYPKSLFAILEICSRLSGNSAGIVVNTAGGVATLTANLNIGANGKIVPLQNEEFSIIISALDADATCDIYTKDENVSRATAAFNFKPYLINADTPTSLDVDDALFIAIPKSGLRSIEVYNDNGKFQKLAAEIEADQRNENPLAGLTDGVVTSGGYDYHTLDVASAKSILVDSSANGNAIAVMVETL